jgi:hypothetical protein
MIVSKPSTKEYRDNYDRVFRKTPEIYDRKGYPEVLKLQDGDVTVLVKTLDGDIYLDR